MKKHLPSAIVLFALLLVLCLHAFAAENTFDSGTGTAAATFGSYAALAQKSTLVISSTATPVAANNVAAELRTTPDITVNGTSIGVQTARTTLDGVTYVAASPVLQTLYPSVVISFQEDRLVASAPGMNLQATAGNCYFLVNDRYFYAPTAIPVSGEDLMLPVSALADALGCSVRENSDTQDLVLKQVGLVASAGTYDADDLYWLSRAIYSEAGNQPMAGRIAVGTVILNRVASDTFPDTVEDVIFAPNQFSPVANGTIYNEPDEESIIAAKLCLDGVREAGDSLYFNVNSMRSWASLSRVYVCTIGGHTFYL
jgi:N-acetylmuramoyl-L-alanine amidase